MNSNLAAGTRDVASLECGGRRIDLPVVGTENEKAVDISNLRRDAGFPALDKGLPEHGLRPLGHHGHRRRARHAALPRLPACT
jgi:hypothetical protein